MERTVRVELGRRSYAVQIAEGLLDQLGRAIRALPRARQAVVVTESNVAALFARRAVASLEAAGLETLVVAFPAGEPHKTLHTVSDVFGQILTHRPPIDRDTILIALGGGVTGDLGGFVAATALRGLRWVQAPTSLLADVDASVGGKTAVDHPAGKNLIGAFHQPAGVLIDVQTLRTLPLRELRNGLAECVKHAVIREPAMLDFLDDHLSELIAGENGKLAFPTDLMVELIARNVAIKAAVVAADERESGVRAHLNYGHTIGHAVESFIGFENIRHGEAVSLGIVAANELAVARGLLDAGVAERIRDTLVGIGLPVTWAGLDAAAVWNLMQHDKKARGGNVNMILPSALASVKVYRDIRLEEVAQALKAVG